MVAGKYAFTLTDTQHLGGVELVLTKNDIADELPRIKVCTNYMINGNASKKFPSSVESLRSAEPVYEELKGWRQSTRGITDQNGLLIQYRNLVKFMEDKLNVHVSMISTDPKRGEVVYLNGWDGFLISCN